MNKPKSEATAERLARWEAKSTFNMHAAVMTGITAAQLAIDKYRERRGVDEPEVDITIELGIVEQPPQG